MSRERRISATSDTERLAFVAKHHGSLRFVERGVAGCAQDEWRVNLECGLTEHAPTFRQAIDRAIMRKRRDRDTLKQYRATRP